VAAGAIWGLELTAPKEPPPAVALCDFQFTGLCGLDHPGFELTPPDGLATLMS